MNEIAHELLAHVNWHRILRVLSGRIMAHVAQSSQQPTAQLPGHAYVKSYRVDQVQEYVAAFQRDGYVVIENVLSEDERAKSIDEVRARACRASG